VGAARKLKLVVSDFHHVEHGTRREPMNAFNPNRYFAERDGEVCLNL
jgi:hypothetical protein